MSTACFLSTLSVPIKIKFLFTLSTICYFFSLSYFISLPQQLCYITWNCDICFSFSTLYYLKKTISIILFCAQKSYILSFLYHWHILRNLELKCKHAPFFQILKQLQELYGNTSAPDDLDLFPGGMLETTHNGPGELFREILLDQFLRIRHGDRFWYENEKNKWVFFLAVNTIKKLKLIVLWLFFFLIVNQNYFALCDKASSRLVTSDKMC